MQAEITDIKPKALSWNDITFPWPGKDPKDGQVVLFINKEGLGVNLVETKDYDLGIIIPKYFEKFIPMEDGTKIILTFDKK